MWMVSMDGYHGYITLALYDGSYVDYLASSPNSKGYDGFMNLIERGPYDLRIWGLRGMGGFLTDIAILMGGPKASSQIEVQ